MEKEKEEIIRKLVRCSVAIFARTFAEKHISQVNDPRGVINMKINNIFIAALGPEIQYYSALARSLDSSLGNMLEGLAIEIAKESYEVSQKVEGVLYKSQTDAIAELLETYKRNVKRPKIEDYAHLPLLRGEALEKRHDSDYYLTDRETGERYLIELKIGGDLDNKKARSEKEALLEQYCILVNSLGSCEKVKILFATGYNRFGEGNPWLQGRVRQFFAEEELCISRDFWNLICKSPDGFDVVVDEYCRNAHLIVSSLDLIKREYLD